MELTKLLKILSSESKLRIIAMFTYCHCNKFTVLELCDTFKLQQANMSKHLSNLHEEGILDFIKDGKEVMYKINDQFLKEHFDLIDLIVKKDRQNTIHTLKCQECKKQ